MPEPRHKDAVIKRTGQQARQGEVGRDRFVRAPMLYVLGVSLVLVVVAMLAAYLMS